jgi:hypothetical protein
MIARRPWLWNGQLRLLLWLSLALGGSACESSWHEAPPLETAKFADVYVGLLQVMVGDSLPPPKADSVFQAHDITRQNFEAASRYYSAEAERWVEVLKLVVAQLDSQMTMEVSKAPRGLKK